MSATIQSIAPKGDKAAILTMDDGTKVWTPELEKAKDLVGKPIPADWTLKEGQYGPQAFPPKPSGGGGGAAAYRNTKDGQRYEQQSMNRRTALMQAVTLAGGAMVKMTTLLNSADELYAWLEAPFGGTTSEPGGGVAQQAERGIPQGTTPVAGSSPAPANRTPQGNVASSPRTEAVKPSGEPRSPKPSVESAVDRQDLEDLYDELILKVYGSVEDAPPKYRVPAKEVPVGKLEERIEMLRAESGGSAHA